MKKLLLALILFLTFSGVIYAASINGDYKGHAIVNVTYEGAKVTPTDVPAILYEGRTLVPLDMLRKIGFDVGWDQATYTADITPQKPEKGVQRVLSFDEINALQDRIALVYGLDDYGVRRWQGSGFMLNSHGLMITANHVLLDEQGNDMQLEVILNGKIYRIPKSSVAFRDKDKDIAGIYLHDSAPFPHLKIGELPEVGDKIYDIGYPQAKFTVYEGNVKFYTNARDRIFDTIQAVDGASGGVTLNQYGEVVGVMVSGSSSVLINRITELYQQSMNE